MSWLGCLLTLSLSLSDPAALCAVAAAPAGHPLPHRLCRAALLGALPGGLLLGHPALQVRQGYDQLAQGAPAATAVCSLASWQPGAAAVLYAETTIPNSPAPSPSFPSPPSREKLFNIIIGVFLAFYAAFALLYPHHDALHLNGMAEQLVEVLPAGLSGEGSRQGGVLAGFRGSSAWGGRHAIGTPGLVLARPCFCLC